MSANQNHKIVARLGYIPEAIMINIPEAFFEHDGKMVRVDKEGEVFSDSTTKHYQQSGILIEPVDDKFSMVRFEDGVYNILTTALVQDDREKAFRRFYEAMGTSKLPEDSAFYHFIGNIPTIDVRAVFVCFKGFVQYKAILVEFLRNQPVMLKDYQHPEPRNWCVTTGPVVKAPKDEFMGVKGQGFRYCKMLF